MSRSPLMFSPLINPTSQDSKLPLTTAFFLRLVHAVQVWEPAPMMEDPASATVARQASTKPIAKHVGKHEKPKPVVKPVVIKPNPKPIVLGDGEDPLGNLR